jgi:ABC-type oligopeptide transport system ATPase subunit
MGNFDSAFERRFLYKIEFNKPETEVKAKIWSSMLKRLSKKDALHLASHFDFSGGQIENIARKRAVDYIIYGKYASIDEIEDYCRAEALNIIDHKKEPKRIGFII